MNNGQVTALVAADRQLVLLEAIHRDVQEVHSIPEANGYANITKEMADLVAKITHSREAANELMAKSLWWKRRQGELLAQTPLHNGDPRLHDATRLSDLNIEKTESHRSQRLATIPKAEFGREIARIEEAKGELTTKHFLKFANRLDRERKQQDALAALEEGDWEPDVRHCSMQELLSSVRELDAIITDPPYSEKFLPLYGELARLAARALKPTGILAVMCGQSYFWRIIPDMSAHMKYRWPLSYLTPGGQSAQIWDRKVNTFWKPILLFGEANSWIGDVVKSAVNDNDKRFHEWGQSVSGMTNWVEMLTAPGDLVCDPFLGGGTIGVACIRLGRRFIGCDLDPAAVALARARLAGLTGETPCPPSE
jgi:site-specific DNA-methyltransferase (adenine-specific)